MKCSLLVLISFLSLNLCAEEIKKEGEEEYKLINNVKLLTADNFDKAIAKFDHLLVLFFAPWCGHCQRFHPDYEKAAGTLLQENIHLAKVDCTVDRPICKKYEVKGFPTVKLFVKGQPENYTSGRKAQQVIDWMRDKTSPVYTNLTTISDLQKFKNRNELSVMYFGTNDTEIKNYENVAKKFKKFPFGVVQFEKGINDYTEGECCKEGGMIIIFKEFFNQRKKLKITANIGEAEIEKFIKEETAHQVLEYNGQVGYIIFNRRYPGLIIFSEKNSPKWFDYQNILGSILDKVGDKVKVILADMKGVGFSTLSEALNVQNSDLPCVKIVEAKRNRKYKMEGEINEENLLKFYEEWTQDKLKPDLRTEREPTENNDDVFILVTTTFDKEVIKNDKDVLVLYYSSFKWGCKEFMPKYEQLAKKLKKDNPNLLVAKIDLLLNELDGLVLNMVPHIKLFKGNNKSNPIDFDGDYKSDKVVDSLINFVKDNAYHKIVYDENKDNKEKTGDL